MPFMDKLESTAKIDIIFHIAKFSSTKNLHESHDLWRITTKNTFMINIFLLL